MATHTPRSTGAEHGAAVREFYDDTCNYVSSFFATLIKSDAPAPKKQVRKNKKGKR